MKSSKSKATDTTLLEAEAKGELVEAIVLGNSYLVNPKAVTSGPALREMQVNGNVWPMYELMIPDQAKRDEFEEALPADPVFGWSVEDFGEAFAELFAQVAGKKA